MLIALRFGDWVAELRSPDFVLHVVGIFPGALMWLICRRGKLEVKTIMAVDAVGLLGTTALYICAGSHIPAEARADTITAFLLSFLLFARAVYVPTTARYTILFGVAMGIPLVVAMYFHYLRADIQLAWDPAHRTNDVVAAIYASATTVWWTLVVGLASLASRVIHGLRQEVRDVQRLGQYTLERKLGEGGMGVVFQATHGMLKRPTAIKLLSAERVTLDAQARFRREVQLTAKLTHPNTVRIHDHGKTPDGVFYCAMELLEGATVREIVEAVGPQPAARVVHILRDAARALNEAHSIGLIHRDVKPGNIMLAHQGGEFDVTKVLDFGLVKATGADPLVRTDSNVVMGTPQYLSPEGIQTPAKVCPQSDLYALGAVGYYLLAGRHVFNGRTIMEVFLQHLQSTPTPLTAVCEEPIPAELEAIVMACLEKRPENRPSSGRSMTEALERVPIARWTLDDAEAWWGRFR